MQNFTSAIFSALELAISDVLGRPSQGRGGLCSLRAVGSNQACLPVGKAGEIPKVISAISVMSQGGMHLDEWKGNPIILQLSAEHSAKISFCFKNCRSTLNARDDSRILCCHQSRKVMNMARSQWCKPPQQKCSLQNSGFLLLIFFNLLNYLNLFNYLNSKHFSL